MGQKIWLWLLRKAKDGDFESTQFASPTTVLALERRLKDREYALVQRILSDCRVSTTVPGTGKS